MKKIRNKKISEFSGFTLIEMLISIAIISFLALLILRITAQATEGLDKITQDAVTVQSAVRFSNLVKYDFSGSKDVFVHTNSAPATANANPCSSYVSGTNDWSNENSPKYVRGLFTLLINDVPYNPSSNLTDIWVDPVSTYVGYEIRKEVSKSANPQFELWRVVCNGSDKRSEKLLELGTGLGIIKDGQFSSSGTISDYSLSGVIGEVSNSAPFTAKVSGISSTIGLRPGMQLINLSGPGLFSGLSTITNVDSRSQITISSTSAITAGNSTFTVSPKGDFQYIKRLSNLDSTTGLVRGCQIFSTAGTGNFGSGLVKIDAILSANTVRISSTSPITNGTISNLKELFPVQSCYSDGSSSVSADYYAFEVPYLGSNTLIKKVNSSEFQKLRSRIDK